MWQSEIIKDIVGARYRSDDIERLYMNAVEKMKSAINFHIDDINGVYDMLVSGPTGKTIELNFNKIKIPFDNLIMTYGGGGGRFATHCLKEDETYYTVREMTFLDGVGGSESSWALMPWYAQFNCLTENWTVVNELGFEDLTDDYIDKRLKEAIAAIWVLGKLLSCKNVFSERIERPEKVNKKRLRKGKLPLYDYHVLKVKTPKSVYETVIGKKEDPAYHNRVHLCRGHFKEFTAEKPLFGRYTGTYWWQPAMRGKNMDGFVDKDYDVEVSRAVA